MINGLEVIVVGGGVGGLTLAGMLTARGAAVTVLERAPEMRRGFGLTLWPNAFCALRQVGGVEQYDAVRSVCQPVDRVVYRLGSGRRVTEIDLVATLGKAYGEAGYAVRRVDLLEALAGVAGTPVRYGADVVAADPAGIVTLADGSTLTTDIVVGADGVRSAVRTSLLPDDHVEPEGLDLRGWQGVVPSPKTPDRRTAQVFFGPTGSSGMFPLPDEKTYWFCLDPGEDAPDPEGWHPAVQDMIRSTPADTMHRDDARDRPAEPNWGDGRVTLLGDAAHPFLPTAGQGACIAIEDAAVLTRRLEQAADVFTALRQFENQRYLRARQVIRVARRLRRMQQVKPLFARDFLLWTTPGFVLQRMVGEPTYPIREFRR